MTEKLKFVQERRKCWVGRQNAVYQHFVYNVLKKAFYRVVETHHTGSQYKYNSATFSLPAE